MRKLKITDAHSAGRVLVSDGAWGTFLHKKGLAIGDCPESWCLNRPNDVGDIAKSYFEAGADMVQTNSFGASCYKLEHYGLSGKVEEINIAAARCSCSAVGDNTIVLGSVGPTGKMLITEEVTEQELYDAFKQQVAALEKGGVDAICIETMSDIGEATLAIKAAREHTKLEVICTFSFDKTVRGDFRTMMGVSPTDAAQECIAAGADIIGTNCGNGFADMIAIVREMRAVSAMIPILVHANAGVPQNINGKDIFPQTPQDMAQLVPDLIAAGANIIGGCCGTTPEHISAIKKAVQRHAG